MNFDHLSIGWLFGLIWGSISLFLSLPWWVNLPAIVITLIAIILIYIVGEEKS